MTIFFVLFGSPLIVLFKMMITRKLGCLHVVFSFPVKPEVPVLLTPLLPIVAIDSVFLILSNVGSVCPGVSAMPPTATAGVCTGGGRVSSIHVPGLRTERTVALHAPSWPWSLRREHVEDPALTCPMLLNVSLVLSEVFLPSVSTCPAPPVGTVVGR